MWVSQWEVIQAGGLLSHSPARPRGRGMGLGKSLKGPIRQGVQADSHLEKVGSKHYKQRRILDAKLPPERVRG